MCPCPADQQQTGTAAAGQTCNERQVGVSHLALLSTTLQLPYHAVHFVLAPTHGRSYAGRLPGCLLVLVVVSAVPLPWII